MPDETWGDIVRYKTDDCDIDNSELTINQGGNGDWYVGVVEEGEYPMRAVRIRTNRSSCPPLGWAISDAYRALRGEQRGDEAGRLYDALKMLCEELKELPSAETRQAVESAIETYELVRWIYKKGEVFQFPPEITIEKTGQPNERDTSGDTSEFSNDKEGDLRMATGDCNCLSLPEMEDVRVPVVWSPVLRRFECGWCNKPLGGLMTAIQVIREVPQTISSDTSGDTTHFDNDEKGGPTD